MKYFFFFIIFCLISINSHAALFKLFSISSGDLYLETNSIDQKAKKLADFFNGEIVNLE